MEVFVVTLVVFLLYFLYQKKHSTQKVSEQFEKWQWWVQINDEEFNPILSGKVVKRTKDFKFYIVGCLHRNNVSPEGLQAPELEGYVGDLIPCHCIVDTAHVVYGGITDEAFRNDINRLSTGTDTVVKVVLSSAEDLYVIDKDQAADFDKAWGDPKLQTVSNLNGVKV